MALLCVMQSRTAREADRILNQHKKQVIENQNPIDARQSIES